MGEKQLQEHCCLQTAKLNQLVCRVARKALNNFLESRLAEIRLISSGDMLSETSSNYSGC